MTGWMIVAIVAIVVSGLVKIFAPHRNRIEGGERGPDQQSAVIKQDDAAAHREIEALRERIKVLERIATDGNSRDASETRRIAQEIEALRDRQDG